MAHLPEKQADPSSSSRTPGLVSGPELPKCSPSTFRDGPGEISPEISPEFRIGKESSQQLLEGKLHRQASDRAASRPAARTGCDSANLVSTLPRPAYSTQRCVDFFRELCSEAARLPARLASTPSSPD